MITGKISTGYRKLLELVTGLSDPRDIPCLNPSSGFGILAFYCSLKIIQLGDYQDKQVIKKSCHVSLSLMNKNRKSSLDKYVLEILHTTAFFEVLRSILICYRFHEIFQ